MKPELTTIEDLDVEGRRVLMRTDFNVPLRAQLDGTAARIADDLKLRAALPTIDELRRRGARVVLVSHLDHPHGRDRGLSMRPVATRLEELTGVAVPVAPAVIGPHVHELVEHVAPGEMLMVENVRLEPGEPRGDPGFAAALADLADLYVNDAFAVSHRAYASTEGVAHWLPSAAGRLLEREVSALSALVERPNQPFVAVARRRTAERQATAAVGLAGPGQRRVHRRSTLLPLLGRRGPQHRCHPVLSGGPEWRPPRPGHGRAVRLPTRAPARPGTGCPESGREDRAAHARRHRRADWLEWARHRTQDGRAIRGRGCAGADRALERTAWPLRSCAIRARHAIGGHRNCRCVSHDGSCRRRHGRSPPRPGTAGSRQPHLRWWVGEP